LNMHHAKTIISGLKDHKAIIAWDIKNEPNLDFDSRGKVNVISWLDNMIDLVKSVDPNHAVTIGWSNVQSASILKDKVDFVSFHYYEDIKTLDLAIENLKKEVDKKPIVLQEFGLSSYTGIWKPFGSSEEDQANYHKKAQEIIAANNLQFMSWTLYDFEIVPKEVVGRFPWRKNTQKRFGFIAISGLKKGAFKFISPK
jgi:endo-1,4-beta-mannosidase